VKKQAWNPVSMYLLILSIPVLYVMFSLVAIAANSSITTTPNVYDNIKITYTLKNPQGGVWNTSEDILIERMGTFHGNNHDQILRLGVS